MKKTLIALMALAGISGAGEITDGMVAVWTFDNGNTGYTSYTGFSGGFTTGLTDNNMVASGGVDGNGYIKTHYEGGNMDFYNGMGDMNISANSFTLSFKVRAVTADYKTLFSMNLGSFGQLNMQTENPDNGNDTCIYCPNNQTLELTEDGARSAIKGNDSWANIIVTGDGQNLTLNINGYTATLAYSASGNLSNFQFGSLWGDGSRRANAQFDDLAIWNRVLDEREIASLANGSTALNAVPEPTTATLSLLALAGLAVRRRRK